MSHFSPTNTHFDLSLPEWAVSALNALPSHLPTLAERMAAVLEFARRNFVHETGGPFAAGVFERDSGRLAEQSSLPVDRVLVEHLRKLPTALPPCLPTKKPN